jgi:hypothetical protein
MANKHWTNLANWGMIDFMYVQVKEKTKKVFKESHYLALNYNKVTIQDNQS